MRLKSFLLFKAIERKGADFVTRAEINSFGL